MNYRTNRFVSVLLLIVYGTLTFVAVPLHFHGDPLFSTGSGTQTLVQHDDALHCKHRVIESHDDCTICSVTTQSAVKKNIIVLPNANSTPAEYTSTVFLIVLLDGYSSHSHRGPPVHLVS